MATVVERRTDNLTASHRKVRDPLRQLRGYIRGYVIAEAVTLLLVSLAVFFWIMLALDYGSFLLGFDWVRDMSRPFRTVLMGLGLLGVVFFVELAKTLRTPKSQPGHDARRGLPYGLIVGLTAGGAFVYLILWLVAGFMRDASLMGSFECFVFAVSPLVVFTAAIVVKRLRIDFADASLALVLEKRYPKILGDRLITAVELNDPKMAARYGYSSEMVELTIHDAAEAVGKLNVREVFDWRRLGIQSVLAGVFTLGLYLAVLIGMTVAAGLDEKRASTSPFTSLNDTAGIWAERNVLLDNERWPTRSIVRLIGFPKGKELKKGRGADGGKDSTRVELNAVAVEYAIHDSAEADSWRALMTSDLASLPVTKKFDASILPTTWKPRDADKGWSVDELKVQLGRKGDKGFTIPENVEEHLAALIAEIDSLAATSGMARTLRKLEIPSQVEVNYRTQDGVSRATVTMTTRAGNEYTVELALRDSVVFSLKAEDYVSDDYTITLVPPPRVHRLTSEEAHPAYLYHLTDTPENDRRLLGSRKQTMVPRRIGVDGLKAKVVVPPSTDLVLRFETTKPLDPEVPVKLDAKGNAALAGIQPVRTGPDSFTVSLRNVQAELEFNVEFKDDESASGLQQVLVTLDEDGPPVIDQFKPDVVREVGGKFHVTPSAVIPFSFFVKDTKGLAELDFVYTIKESPTAGEKDRRAMRVAGGVGLALAGPESGPAAYGYNRLLPATLRGSEETIQGRIPVAHFKLMMDGLRRGRNWDAVEPKLRIPSALDSFPRMLSAYNVPDLAAMDAYLRDHDISIEDCVDIRQGKDLKGMDLSRVPYALKARRSDKEIEVQRKFDMSVWLEARDTNVSKPLRGRHESQPIAFEIVSEIELLFEINQDEQRLYDELAKVVADLKGGFTILQGVKFELQTAPQLNYLTLSVNVDNVQKAIAEGKRISSKVHLDYEKILREMRTNRIEDKEAVRRTKNDIVLPLGKILVGDYRINDGGKEIPAGFTVAHDGMTYLRDAVDDSKLDPVEKRKRAQTEVNAAEKDMENLIKSLNEIVQQMKGVVELGEILKNLKGIEEGNRASHEQIKLRIAIIEAELFGTPPPK